MPNSVLNLDLLDIARHYVEKQAFVDPSMMAGGMPPGGDPAAMGGMPPGGDPAAMGMPPGGDPAAMGMDPAMMGGGAPPPPAPGVDPIMLQQMVQQAVQQAQAGGGAAGGGAAAGGIKPKIDVNVAIMQMSKMIARICDAMGIAIPASEMIATPADLNQMAAQQSASASAPAQQSSISGIEPIQGASPALAQAGGGEKTGSYGIHRGEPYPFDDVLSVSSRASAIGAVLQKRRAN